MNKTSIDCYLTIENLSQNVPSVQSKHFKCAKLQLCRNEFRDIVVMINSGKFSTKFVINDFIIHSKFVKEGKATLKLPKQNVQLLISNCPSDQLILFLKLLHTKSVCMKVQQSLCIRDRMRSNLPIHCQEISPLALKDITKAQNIITEDNKKIINDSDINKTRKPSQSKRKLLSQTPSPKPNKENTTPTKPRSKCMRKLLTQTLYEGNFLSKVIKLTKEQVDVLNAVLSGRNLFFTGSAGTGKSFLLQRIIGSLPPDHTFATASTGIAACHIGGTTLHSFAGIGSGRGDIQQCTELARRPHVIQQWKKCRHLIIDEISMIPADYFDKLETVARLVRGNNEPFGGIQLILCGDFLQLPPVTKCGEKKFFCFQSRAWSKCIDTNMQLREVKRQSDETFIALLNELRYGRCTEKVCSMLKNTAKNRVNAEGIVATRLCTHKDDVDLINKFHLNKISGESRTFEAIDSDSSLRQLIDSHCPVSQRVHLVVGSQVMLMKNLDISKGLVNGSRGYITGFQTGEQGFPIVKFASGRCEVVQAARWSFKLPVGTIASRIQVPLTLAWAISIHKSQGMTLDCVEMSLSKVFECGQAYVALSRAKSLSSLRVLDFDRNCIKANMDVLKFYGSLNLK